MDEIHDLRSFIKVLEAAGQLVRIRRRVDRDGLDPHLLGGAVDAQGDLAPVRDQDLLEHHRPFVVVFGGARRPKRNGRPGCPRTAISR